MGYPYTLSFNYSDIARLSGFTFVPEVKNGRFNFSIKRTLNSGSFPMTLKLDPTVSIEASLPASTSLYFPCQRKLCRSSNGVIYVVYYANRGTISKYQVVLSYTRNNGSTWTKKTVSPNGTGACNSTNPSIAIDSNNVIHITWINEPVHYAQRTRIQYRRYFQSNGSFAVNVQNFSDIGYRQLSPSIAVDGNNNCHIVWYGNTSTTGTVSTIRHIWFNTATGLWSSIDNTSIVAATSGHARPSVAIDSSNNMHVVWDGDTGSAWRSIHYRKWYSSNSTWNTKMINITDSSAH